MGNLMKGIKIASKIAEVILAISIIGDLVGKYGGKLYNKPVASDVEAEIASTENIK